MCILSLAPKPKFTCQCLQLWKNDFYFHLKHNLESAKEQCKRPLGIFKVLVYLDAPLAILNKNPLDNVIFENIFLKVGKMTVFDYFVN